MSKMRRGLFSVCRVVGAVAAIVVLAGCLVAQPTFRRNRASALRVDGDRLRAHVAMLSERCHPRDWTRVDNLDRCAEYIAGHFTNAGAKVEFQSYEVEGRRYSNVIARFGVGKGSKVIVGAHYDAHESTPGADDNASGVAALIELAYLFARNEPEREVELVAYTLEEPPFFRTPLMGSVIHAASVAGDATHIAGVIVLEMVGRFCDERGSQSYPSLLLKLVYPSRGNFIAVVGSWGQGDWVKTIKAGMKGATDLPVYSIRAPTVVPGVDFSDHMNYWPHGIPAIMVTDTAFYRNRAYHTPDDKPDRLDYGRMSKVVVGVFEAIRAL
jgi:Zn-dependent M28 family amino/carboxypeptidase